jgi:hypothetical protein
MRYFIVLLLIFLFNCDHKNEETGTLKIVPTYCKYKFKENYKFPIPREYVLFSASKEIPALLEDEFLFENLPFGDYYIEYITIYNQRKRLKFKMDETFKEICYCTDAVLYDDDKNILFIDELKTDETLLLQQKTRGCFHRGKEELKITKTETAYILSYLDKNYTLSKSQVQLFREFEIELYKNHSDRCSTIDTYHIGFIRNSRNLKSYAIIDGSCAWNGFSNLIQLLNFE